MHKDKFGFPRGRCTAGSCACERFVVTKGTHDCKTCYHAPRHHEYYNKETQQQQRPEQHNDNHQPLSTKKKQTTTFAGKKFLTMVSIETPFPFLAGSITIHHFLKIVEVEMKFNYYIIIIVLIWGYWGWGSQLMGFAACGVGPSGFFGLGVYKHKRINLVKKWCVWFIHSPYIQSLQRLLTS